MDEQNHKTDSMRMKILGGIDEAFSDRNFCIYSVGSIASWISFFVQLVAVSWLTWELTESTLWLAIIALLDIVPGVVLAPFTGVFADRYDRHRIMIWVCALSLLQAAALALFSWIGMLDVRLLAVLVVIHSILIAFMVPAMYGILPRFVARPVLPSAIAVSSSYVQASVFAGPALAGWIISSYGVSWAFLVNAIGYLILTFAFLGLRTPAGYAQPSPEPGSVFGQIRDGVDYLIRDRRILTFLVLGVAVQAITMGTFHMLPAYSEQILEMGVEGMATLLAVEGLGATAAALWIARGGAGLVTQQRVIWSALVAIIAAAAIICTPDLYVALSLAIVLGIAAEIRKTGIITIVQLNVDEKQRGRVMSTWFMFAQIAGGIGAFVIGQAAVAYGLRLPTVVVAGICISVWLVIYLKRRQLIGDEMEN